MSTQTPAIVTLSAATRAAITKVVKRAVGHYTGVPSLFIDDVLPTILTTEVGTDATGQPVELRSVDPDVWTTTLDTFLTEWKAEAKSDGLAPGVVSNNATIYRRRIIERVTRKGIALPAEADAQAEVTEAAQAAAADDAFAEDIVANGDPIAAVVEALQTRQWSLARAIIRAMQKAAKARK